MADVSNPVYVQHCNTYIRLLAEATRNLYFQMKIHKQHWDALGLGTVFTNSPEDMLIDGRQDPEGVAQLTLQEVRRIGLLLPDDIIALCEGTQATGLAACVKGSVRPLKVTE